MAKTSHPMQPARPGRSGGLPDGHRRPAEIAVVGITSAAPRNRSAIAAVAELGGPVGEGPAAVDALVLVAARADAGDVVGEGTPALEALATVAAAAELGELIGEGPAAEDAPLRGKRRRISRDRGCRGGAL